MSEARLVSMSRYTWIIADKPVYSTKVIKHDKPSNTFSVIQNCWLYEFQILDQPGSILAYSYETFLTSDMRANGARHTFDSILGIIPPTLQTLHETSRPKPSKPLLPNILYFM